MSIPEIISAKIRRTFSYLDVYFIEDNALLADAVNIIYWKNNCGQNLFRVEYYDKYMLVHTGGSCAKPQKDLIPIRLYYTDPNAITKLSNTIYEVMV
jgi:hypothetical protein